MPVMKEREAGSRAERKKAPQKTVMKRVEKEMSSRELREGLS